MQSPHEGAVPCLGPLRAPRCSKGPRRVTVSPYPSPQSFLGIFRSLPSLEKSVGKCLILFKPRASRLVLQLHCKYGEYQQAHGLGSDTAQWGTSWHRTLPR